MWRRGYEGFHRAVYNHSATAFFLWLFHFYGEEGYRRREDHVWFTRLFFPPLKLCWNGKNFATSAVTIFQANILLWFYASQSLYEIFTFQAYAKSILKLYFITILKIKIIIAIIIENLYDIMKIGAILSCIDKILSTLISCIAYSVWAGPLLNTSSS